MNLPELEQISEKKVKAIESNKKEPGYCIEYLNQPPFKSLRDSILAQIKSCEQLLKNTKVPSERNAIEREILILVLILELLEYWWKMLENITWYRSNLTINYSLIDKGSESSKIKELIHDLRSKQYVFSIVPEKLIHMNNGIKYYYVEAARNGSKMIINAYGAQADELFSEVHKYS
jgi:hypothetical protein